MRSLRLAATRLVRQPARAALGILGVAAVGALLFDMLLLSRGLVVSFRDVLDRTGFDVRIMATDSAPFSGSRIADAAATSAGIAALEEVETVLPTRMAGVEIASGEGGERVALIGATVQGRRLWTIVEGADLSSGGAGHAPTLVVNRRLASALKLAPGSTLRIRGDCGAGSALPAASFRVIGIAEFPFDHATQLTAAASLADLRRVCGAGDDDEVDLLLAASRAGAGAEAAADAIRRARPDLHVFTNADLVERFRRLEFSYFRQISTVLATVTLFFGFLLIAVLLTVSVNQRLGEIAGLRALGLSRARLVADVLWESALLAGTGGLLAIPLGWILAIWLDGILRAMPGVPADLRFFAYEPRALVIHLGLVATTAAAAAAYPMVLVARLPIATTLRNEVVS
jgi:putative ABC transport system permease protein